MKISKRVSELLRLIFPFSGFSKGHNSEKNAGRVMVLVLCILSNHALYLYKVSLKYLKGFQRY